MIPRRRAPKITAKASYIKTRLLWLLVRPIARRTPNSQRFSLMLAVVEISKRKKERVRAIVPTIPTKIWNMPRLPATES